jgi:hypothetical protein
MPNKNLRKYNKSASSLPMKAEGAIFLLMKAEGEALLFFHFFAHFLLRQEILEEVKKNLYIFGGGMFAVKVMNC